MKNVVTILVDSVFSECLSNGRTVESSTPFLDSIIPSSLYAKNVFSYGPYTEAATKGLFCGSKTLDDYGYLYSINSSEYTHYRVFSENGYETVGLYYPFFLISSKVEQYIDHSIYISGFHYESIWNGKFKYYAEKETLTKQEYEVLKKCLDMIFDSWLLFYENVKTKESSFLVDRLKNNSMDGESLLKRQYALFKKGEYAYIDGVLTQGMKHPLAYVNDYDYNKIVLRSFVNKIFLKYKMFFRKVERIEFKLNWKNNFPDSKHIIDGIKGIFNFKKRDSFRYIENFGMSLFGNKFLRHKAKRDMWQIEASMMSQINALFHFVDNRRNCDKPFYISMHTEEPHNRLAYFTYDIPDYKLIHEEIQYLKPLLDNVGADFAGHLIYQLSLRYVDLCIKRLFEGLKQRNLLSETTIMIMADHGSSYTLNPLRKTMTNNFYMENYKVPLVIWSEGTNLHWKGKYSGMFQSENIFPTICSIEGLDYKNKFRGKSILECPKGNDYVITEYMGPGCPDMLEREVWMSINNNNFIVAVRCPINKKMDYDKIVEVYDLGKDPNQLYNIVDDIQNNEEVFRLFGLLESRFIEIVQSTKKIHDGFDSFCVKNE